MCEKFCTLSINLLFEDYQAGFNDYDRERIADCFALPTTIWQLEKGHIFSDEDEILENIDALLKALEKEDIAHSQYQIIFCEVTNTSAIAKLRWSQENGTGESVFEFSCDYHLIRLGEEWLIASIVNELP